ncbi:transposase family protein [Streptomyces sp. NPDC041003]|uniref:transposase family protein n=1 Tax=Streptomyces sp. NPDC041003 TaxID=3155730 RepID=UPI0033CE3584
MSDRAHDSYQRRLKDLPLGGQSALIHLTVRRFLCDTRDCPRRTVAEPFAQLTAPYVRFTTRLNHVLEHVGLALAGRAGARLADQLEGASDATKTLLPELSSGRLQLGGLITYEVAKRYISIDDSGSGLLHSVHG